MKRFIIVIIPSLISLSLGASALALPAQAQPLRTKQRSYVTKDIEEHYRLGHRRSALAQYQNAERRALQRHQEEERKLARLRGINRRALAEHQRAEQRRLNRRQQLQRAAFRSSRGRP
jgi:hypothetical protein